MRLVAGIKRTILQVALRAQSAGGLSNCFAKRNPYIKRHWNLKDLSYSIAKTRKFAVQYRIYHTSAIKYDEYVKLLESK